MSVDPTTSVDTTWIDACAAFGREHGVATDEIVGVLGAFDAPFPRGGPPPPPEQPWAASFEALERAVCATPIVDALVDDLAIDVDRGQAELFARRVLAVDAFLAAHGDPIARLLRVGLRHRLAGILAATRPHATRVRALADFYYSHGCRHRHRIGATAGLPELVDAVAGLRWRAVCDGLEHAEIDGRFAGGPTHVNLLRVDPRRIELEVADLREQAHAGVPFATSVANAGAIAATSGGFFLYSEPDIAAPSRRHDPVGLVVRGGEVVAPPVFARGALWLDADGGAALERIGLTDVTARSARGWVRTLDRAIQRAHAERGPDAPSFAVVGRTVVAVGVRLPIPLNGFVVMRDGLEVEVGDVLTYAIDRRPAPHSAIAGGPMLVESGAPVLALRREDFWGSAPPVTFSQDETGDQNLLPRLGVGLRDGALVFAAVDGRNLDRALGMTLGELARLFVALGCERAVNLDGGSSKRMLVEGQTLDLPSTEVVGEAALDPSVRPVYSAILMRPRR